MNQEIVPQQTESASALILDFPDSRIVKTEFQLFVNHLVYSILLLFNLATWVT